MSWTSEARVGSGVLRQCAMSRSIWPSRRSTVATRSRAKARSRGCSDDISKFSSMASSSGRRRRSTAAIKSTATLRALAGGLVCAAAGSGMARRPMFPRWPKARDFHSRNPDANELACIHPVFKVGCGETPWQSRRLGALLVSMSPDRKSPPDAAKSAESVASAPSKVPVDPKAPRPSQPREIGGPTGPEPTRYGDWERNGRCTDF